MRRVASSVMRPVQSLAYVVDARCSAATFHASGVGVGAGVGAGVGGRMDGRVRVGAGVGEARRAWMPDRPPLIHGAWLIVAGSGQHHAAREPPITSTIAMPIARRGRRRARPSGRPNRRLDVPSGVLSGSPVNRSSARRRLGEAAPEAV